MERDRILDHLAVEASPDGQVLAQSNNSGFLALYALAHCRDVPDRRPDSSDYYSDSLRVSRDDGHPFQLIVGSCSTR